MFLEAMAHGSRAGYPSFSAVALRRTQLACILQGMLAYALQPLSLVCGLTACCNLTAYLEGIVTNQ